MGTVKGGQERGVPCKCQVFSWDIPWFACSLHGLAVPLVDLGGGRQLSLAADKFGTVRCGDVAGCVPRFDDGS